MKEPTKSEYVQAIWNLLFLRDTFERIFAHQDLKLIDDLIDIVRWYMQFIK